MIRDLIYNEEKPWLNIQQLEIVVDKQVVEVEARYLGLFEMSDFKEVYINSLGSVNRIRTCGYVLIEIHESQIAEIEHLYMNNNINQINVLFDDGHMELFNILQNTFWNCRITSQGDLRIEIGKKQESVDGMINHYRKCESTPDIMFPKNWKYTTCGVYEYMEETTRREGTTTLGEIDYSQKVLERLDLLKDVLGEIVAQCGKKRISKEKLVALATIVDYNFCSNFGEKLHIKEYTDLDRKEFGSRLSIRNSRIGQLKYRDYINRSVNDSGLKSIIHAVCDDKDITIEKMIDTVMELQFNDI